MRFYKGTGCQILLVGTLKSMPKYDKNTQTFFAILERKKPYFDHSRQFLQEDTTWFRVTLNEKNLKNILKNAHIGTSIAITCDFIDYSQTKPMDYTAAMIDVIAETIDFIPTDTTGSTYGPTPYTTTIENSCLLH